MIIHYTSDNGHFLISHLKIILINCPYLSNWVKALTLISVAVKKIKSWNKHFPIIVPKLFTMLSFWPSVINRVTNYSLKQFNKARSDNSGLEGIQAATQGNTVRQKALMIHSPNPLFSSTMSGLKGFRETLSGRRFLAYSYIWQLIFNLYFTLSCYHYPRIIHEHFSNIIL